LYNCNCNCNCSSLLTSFLSHQVSIFTHMHSVHFSALSIHYPQCKTLPVRTCKCRLLDHGYNAVTDDCWAVSHLVPRILHWLLTEEVEKVEKGQILWVHTYPTTPSRPRGRCVQSLVQIGSEMWICIRNKQTNKQKRTKNHFIFVYTRRLLHGVGSFDCLCRNLQAVFYKENV